MPELPEVEVIRRALQPHVVGKRIASASVIEPRLTRRRGTPQTVAHAVRGQRVVALRRRGKFFLFDLGENSLIVHLGMTGQLLWWQDAGMARRDKHTHACLRFSGGGILAYRDARKFGEVFVLPTASVESTLKVGPEPLDSEFTAAVLTRICGSSEVRIKSLLLDQRRIAGVGNIYADEALFRAGVRPTRRASTLRPDECRALWKSIRDVLRAGIRHGGSSISDYRDPYGEPGRFAALHRVYQRHTMPCGRCGTAIVRIVIGQRGTHFCPKCQR